MRPLLQLLATLGAVFAFFLEVLHTAATSPRYVGETVRIMATLVKRCIIPVGLAVALCVFIKDRNDLDAALANYREASLAEATAAVGEVPPGERDHHQRRAAAGAMGAAGRSHRRVAATAGLRSGAA